MFVCRSHAQEGEQPCSNINPPPSTALDLQVLTEPVYLGLFYKHLRNLLIQSVSQSVSDPSPLNLQNIINHKP